MKKVVFSLVAFMAFSVSAFANTMEVKEEVVVVETDCFENALDAEAVFNAFTGGSVTFYGITITSYDVFSASYTACVATQNCPSCLEGN
jgi:hypothetical protein